MLAGDDGVIHQPVSLSFSMDHMARQVLQAAMDHQEVMAPLVALATMFAPIEFVTTEHGLVADIIPPTVLQEVQAHQVVMVLQDHTDLLEAKL